jgi:hypothetical protein
MVKRTQKTHIQNTSIIDHVMLYKVIQTVFDIFDMVIIFDFVRHPLNTNYNRYIKTYLRASSSIPVVIKLKPDSKRIKTDLVREKRDLN